MSLFHRCLLVAAVLGPQWGLASADEGQRWIYEGLITESSPSLAPDLQSGWVLAGSFRFLPMLVEEEFTQPELRSGRMTGGIEESELTVDLYYRVRFLAAQGEGLSGFDYQNDHPEEDGRDLLGWFFPMEGKLGQSGWDLQWLQIWLADPEGRMITHLPVQIAPAGINWKTGWFRMTFINEGGQTAHADGRIEIFAPENASDDAVSSEGWYAVAADLSAQLLQRDSTIAGLQSELVEVRARVDGLRRMVDLLVGERSELQRENALLSEQAQAADPATVRQLTELTAEKSLLEDELAGLSGQAESLQRQLVESEQDRLALVQRIAELEAAAIAPAEQPSTGSLPEATQAGEAPPQAFGEAPVQRLEKEPPPGAVPEPAQIPVIPEDEPDTRFHSTRPKGPRKFR